MLGQVQLGQRRGPQELLELSPATVAWVGGAAVAQGRMGERGEGLTPGFPCPCPMPALISSNFKDADSKLKMQFKKKKKKVIHHVIFLI